MLYAAEGGHLEVLEMGARNVARRKYTAPLAAYNGYLEVL